MRFEVTAAIASVHVREEGGREHEVVHRGVEVLPRVERAARDLNLAQLTLPREGRLAPHALEVPMVKLGCEVAARAFNVNRRDADTHRDRLALPRVEAEEGADVATARLASFGRVALVERDAERVERLGELGDEVDDLVARPRLGAAVAFDAVTTD